MASGLIPSIQKSSAFFCNVPRSVKSAILDIMPFAEGTLPIKYLGVPLISSRLKIRDCKILVDRVKNKVGDWKNKCLSLAGRLQLIQSILSSMHIYWASVFSLPSSVIVDIEKILAGFLWCQGEMKKGKAKVKWKNVCLPKSEGGLGIRRLEEFNTALLLSHVWKVLIRKEALWVRWIHAYKLRNRGFWEIKMGNNLSWGWRKLLKIRPVIRDFLWIELGDGCFGSAWFDKWDPQGPIINHITNRGIYNAGFNTAERVVDVVDIVNNGEWSWPNSWLSVFPALTFLKVPILVPGNEDKLFLRTTDGNLHDRSVALFWDTIREKGDNVVWHNLVWSPLGIPKYSIHLWLIMKNKLKTQDRLKPWDVDSSIDLNSLRCFLCGSEPDSRAHLFFMCPFASKILIELLKFAHLPLFIPIWDNILDWEVPLTRNNRVEGIVARLIISVAAYLIWHERNARLHGKMKKSEVVIINLAIQIIRMKLTTISFKKKNRVKELKKIWRITWE